MFEQREQTFENAFAHDEALRFRTRARRNRLIGLWAAERLGMTGDAAEAYATALVEDQVGAANDEALVARLTAALATAAPEISAHRVRRRLEEAGAEAARRIQAGR